MGTFAAKRRPALVLGLTLFTIGCNGDDADRLARLGRMAAAQVASLATDPDGKLTKGWQAVPRSWDDSTLNAKVALRLRWDKGLATTPIQVKANGGVIELKGVVHNLAQRRRAVELAESTEGVERVIDMLEVPSVEP